MTRLELTVILLLGILGSFAFSKKPDPLANKKKVSWVTKTGSVRSHCLRSWFRSTCSSTRRKTCWSALDRRWSNRAATSDVVVDDISILFQSNEKIRWRGFFMWWSWYLQNTYNHCQSNLFCVFPVLRKCTWSLHELHDHSFLSLIALSSFSILLSTCLVLQHGSFVPREWQAGPPCPFAIEVKCLPSLSPQIEVFYFPFTSLV